MVAGQQGRPGGAGPVEGTRRRSPAVIVPDMNVLLAGSTTWHEGHPMQRNV